MANNFNTRDTLTVNGKTYTYCNLNKIADKATLEKLPITLRVLLENTLRREGGIDVKQGDIDALLSCARAHKKNHEVSFMPARVILQDFTGVPAIVDLAAKK